ncbi:MAG TPA: hypothetical protein VKW08_27755 [Xanthobacteraceae bacterium]|nr:hypothetical protein [Xanthobacteraceae bacterium]
MRQASESSRVSLVAGAANRVVIALAWAGALLSTSVAADDCSPHCDYWHDYGPYDFSYISPGLVGYPHCNREGNCSPYLTYVYPERRHLRITVRPLRGAGPVSTVKGRN